MGYGDYLKNLLAPLRIYELDSGIGACELEAAGGCLDEVFDRLVEIEEETLLPTAKGEGLEAFESILPYVPLYGTVAERRAAIAALLRIDGASFTLEDMCDTLAGCGVAARVEEGGTPQTVVVSFPQNRGVPVGFEIGLRDRIESILPCHLGIEYVFSYPTWEQLEAMFATWGELEERGLSWAELERLEPV